MLAMLPLKACMQGILSSLVVAKGRRQSACYCREAVIPASNSPYF